MLISVKNNYGLLKVFLFYDIIYQFANVFSEQNLRVLIIIGFYLESSSNIRYINVEKKVTSPKLEHSNIKIILFCNHKVNRATLTYVFLSKKI